MSLNIISADPSPDATFPILSVARTLRGHKAAVTDTHIVGVGKTIYSCGKDGTIRLWDVAEASKIGSTLTSEGFNPIVRMNAETVANTESTNPGASLEGHVLYAALQNGTFNVFDTRASRLVYASPLSRRAPALQSIASDSSSRLLATGNTTGIVAIYDIRQLPSQSSSPLSPLCSFKRSDSSIDDLLFTNSSQTTSLLVATGDGFPFRVSVSSGGRSPQVVEEYAAHGDEGVRAIRTRLRHVIDDDRQSPLDIWTAGDDGLARRY